MTHGFAAVLLLTLCLSGCTTPPDVAAIEARAAAKADRQGRLSHSLPPSEFRRAITHAVLASPDLGRADADVLARWADWLEGRDALWPRLRVGIGGDGTRGFSASPFVALDQLIFDGNAQASEQVAARARYMGQSFTRFDHAQHIAFEAISAWAEVEARRALLRASNDTLAALTRQVTAISARAEAGAGSSLDALNAKSRLQSERARAVQAENDLGRARARYLQLFASPAPATLSALPKAPRLSPQAAQRAPHLDAAEAEILAAEADLAAAEAGLWPALSWGASRRSDQPTTASPHASYDVVPARGRESRRLAAQARLKAARANALALRREYESQLQIMAVERRNANALVVAAQKAAQTSAAHLAEAELHFTTGGTDLMTLLDASREALSAQQYLILTRQDMALIDWRHLALSGDLLAALAITLPEAQP